MVKMADYIKKMRDIEELYLNDKRPWIIGFSGGKDSSCIVQMIYYMLKNIPPEKRTKEIHILSSDTLVENPMMEARMRELCTKIEQQAKKDLLPIKVKLLKPELNDTFWVNLIGKGYPSPNRWFRWCTDRLKIRPMTKYILEQVRENGEVIILLGIRKSESSVRSRTMKEYEIENFKLRKHATIAGAYISAPIEDWMEEEVWEYLYQVPPPWGENNNDLRRFYRKGDTEVEFITDKSASPSGASRFGCWTCTVVEKDRALEGFIDEGEDWLIPLLEFRNWLKEIRDESAFREKVRKVHKKKKIISDVLGREFTPTEHCGHKVLGPFTFEARHEILRRLIKLQEKVACRGITLISPEEIKAIETIWLYEGDKISSIVEVLGLSKHSANGALLDEKNIAQLEVICSKHKISVKLIERLLIVEKDLSTICCRKGIYERLEKVIDEYVLDEMSKECGGCK